MNILPQLIQKISVGLLSLRVGRYLAFQIASSVDFFEVKSKRVLKRLIYRCLIEYFIFYISYKKFLWIKEMVKKLILILWLICIVKSLNCQYSSQSNCISSGCQWNNNTCAVGNGVCQTGKIYSSTVQQCIQCSTLSSNNCTQLCSEYYYSSNLLACVSCSNIDAMCLTCNNSRCFSCVSGFSVNENYTNQCLIDQCKIRFCQKCSSNTTCYICSTGYVPGANETFCSVSSCSIKNCLYCYDSNSCVTCQTGYLLSTNGKTCTLVCDDPFCSTCLTHSTCSSCLSGYYFNTNTGYCQLSCIVPSCSSCDLSSTCTVCANGYTVNNAHTLCNPICTDANCVSCQTPSKCTSCASGFYLSANSCLKAICYIDYCVTCATSLKCSACDIYSTLSNNQTLCIQNCLSAISNCKVCSSNTTCSACFAGYQLSKTATSCNLVCHIINCAICLTSSLCSFCSNGYITNSDGTACLFNCGILNCQTCNSSTTCQTCIGAYSLSSSGTSCVLNCSPGFYVDTAASTCTSCTSKVSNCATCSLSTTSNTIICSRCLDLYYLTSYGLCKYCGDIIKNCLLCLDPTHCISCQSGYNLVYLNSSYLCSLPYTCNVQNCLLCSNSNPYLCTTCNNAYYLTNNNANCSAITCKSTQIYDSNTLSCVCPSGTFFINQVCSYCNLDNCITCNSAGCMNCKARYYPKQGKCQSCLSFCVNCTSGTSCLQCDYGYKLQAGVCVTGDSSVGTTNTTNSTNSSIATCPPGCSACTYYMGAIYCTLPMSGYAIDPSTGEIIKCSDNCLTCASLAYSVCTSCYGASILNGGTCIGCEDLYALTCPKNIKYATSCVLGYSPISGVCRQCAPNCVNCGLTGYNKCDDGGCSSGYVKIKGTQNCTKCFSSCSTCTNNNPSVCLSCGVANYLSNTSSCVPCPTACLSCTSATVCTSCSSTSILDSGWCYASIGYPCSKQSKSSCVSCYVGYSLNQGACLSDISCNATSSCSTCNKNYYLKKSKCYPCSTTTNCDYCQPSAPSLCLQCSAGYYLKRSNSQCTACLTGCAQCISAQVCSAAISGYYLQVDEDGEYTGKTKQCSSSCATCSVYNQCDTCATDYKKVGVTCIYKNNINAQLTLNPAQGSNTWFNSANSDQENLANGFIQLNQIINSIAHIAGVTSDRIIIISLSLGSLIVNAVIVSDPAQDFTAFSQNFASNVNSLPDFTLISSNLSVNGVQAQSSANIGLILGITIPLIVLLAIIIIVVKIKISESDEKSTEQTQKQIQEFQM